jgi:peptidoglycan hydrolase-like protein with peptidoglycan-binding domain
VESEPAPPPVEQQPDPPAEEEPDPRPTQAEPTQPEPDPEPPAPADPGAPGREHCHYSDDRSKEVSEGMSGEEVREIQCLLVYNYGKDLDLDGIFGPLTENAVKEVQACSGLDADGIVGPMTWPVLDSPKPECAA